MQIVVRDRQVPNKAHLVLLLLVYIAGLTVGASAQSIDLTSPSPVRTNEVVGTIAARDLGDPRLTDHFYAFTGTPGDVLITVESANLNGDIDVFTLNGLRPLLKFTIFAGSSSPITKSIYLRTREELLLRVEGRTPNDDTGTYKLHFGGSFEPITTAPLVAEGEPASNPPSTVMTRTGKKGRRVSSVGARIEEPPEPEVAAAPTVESTPSDATEPESKTAAPKASSRSSRARRPASRRGRSSEPEKTAAKNESESKPSAEGAEVEPPTTSTKKRPTKRSASARSVTKPPAEQEPQDSGPRLVVETIDGTLVDRYMT
ncbi:MAG: hypothetical protein ABR556_13535, partial [Pyrinomonadaceae bacterium]